MGLSHSDLFLPSELFEAWAGRTMVRVNNKAISVFNIPSALESYFNADIYIIKHTAAAHAYSNILKPFAIFGL